MNYRTVLTTLGVTAIAVEIAAETTSPAIPQSDNLLLRGTGIALVVVMIWTFLYKGLYPYLLRYYRDGFSKTVFWQLFFLYSLTWLFVSFYVILDVGFYWGWLPWVALFLGAWWLISGVVLLLRRVQA